MTEQLNELTLLSADDCSSFSVQRIEHLSSSSFTGTRLLWFIESCSLLDKPHEELNVLFQTAGFQLTPSRVLRTHSCVLALFANQIHIKYRINIPSLSLLKHCFPTEKMCFQYELIQFLKIILFRFSLWRRLLICVDSINLKTYFVVKLLPQPEIAISVDQSF